MPDKNYTDYHLDIALMLNPYDVQKAGQYTYLDIMQWDWFAKDLSRPEVLQAQKHIFTYQ